MFDNVTEIEPTHPLSVLRQHDGAIISDTTLGEIIGSTTDTHAEQVGLGVATQDLSNLHRLVRGLCSDLYRELGDENPDVDKEQINADPQLMALNSVRRTLHQAMVRRQKQAAKLKRGTPWRG